MNQVPTTWEQRCELLTQAILAKFPATNYAGTVVIGDYQIHALLKSSRAMTIDLSAPNKHYALYGNLSADGKLFLKEIVTNTGGAKFRTGSMFRSEIDSAGGRELLRNLELIVNPED